MATADLPLAGYLRARRSRVSPEEAGLPAGGRRRVSGLRRAEVATLAGISVEYYLRLEQGKDQRPSPGVLRSIAGALHLDASGEDYLLSLIREPVPEEGNPEDPTLLLRMRRLVDVLPTPAFVEDRHFDVLAANAAASALSPHMTAGSNRLRAMFLEADERALFVDWEDTAARILAGYRRSIGADTSTPRTVQLVNELQQRSHRFRRLWAEHDVQYVQGAPVRLEHPRVGRLTLHREKFLLGDTGPALTLSIHHADAGSESARKLQELTGEDVIPRM